MKYEILNDYLNLLSTLTLKKLSNIFRLFIGYYLSRIINQIKNTFSFNIQLSTFYIHKGLPFALSIEPTTYCNLQCPECPTGMKQLSRPSGNLSYELFKKIIDEVHSNLIYLTLYFQGEPFLNKQFFDFFAYAKARNIYVSTSTNAHFLYDDNCRKIIESGLDRIIISMDGMTQDTYSSYRKNGNIDDVIKGIVNLVSLRKKLGSRKPFIILQFLVLKTNEHEINEIKKFVKDYGIDSLQLKSAQFYNYINGNPLMPSDEKYSRYSRQNDGTYRIKSPLQNHCFRMWTSAVITWDGTVVPCCFDKNADYRLGSLNDATFSSIWRSKEYVQFRNKIITCRKSINICTNCISC